MPDEAAGRTLEDVFRIIDEDTRQPVENPALRALKRLAEETRAEALAGLAQAEIEQLHGLLSRILLNLSGEEK